MSREIRITIDDDEVFERMKARKGELDLSWEEVLHRGLRREPAASPGPERQRHRAADEDERGWRPEGSGGPAAYRGTGQGGDRWDAMADSLESEIQSKVYDTLRRSFGAAGIEFPEDPGLDAEMASLEQAEDAELSFPGVDAEPSNRVPLRVTLRTGTDGLDIDVVAVRTGKSVAEQNAFTGTERATVISRLAKGETATLTMADGVESYEVVPVLEWGRDDRDRPTVRDVEIAEVVFDAD